MKSLGKYLLWGIFSLSGKLCIYGSFAGTQQDVRRY